MLAQRYPSGGCSRRRMPTQRRSASRQARVLDLVPVADELHGRPRVTPSGPATPTKTVPTGLPSWGSGPATPVVRHGVRRAGQPPGSPSAIARGALARHHAVLLDERGGHPQQRLLELGGVGDDARRGSSPRPRHRRDRAPRAARRSATRPWPASRPPAASSASASAAVGSCAVSTHPVARAAPRLRSPTWPPDRGLRHDRRPSHRRPRRHATARSTGCACRASTPPPASPPSSATPRTAAGSCARSATTRSPRAYIDDSAALQTTFTTDTGVVTLLDVMPTGDGRIDVVRRVTGVSGTVRMHHEWVVRFDYGTTRPWVRRRHEDSDEPVITAVAGPDKLVLRGPRLPHAVGPPARGRLRRPRGRDADLLDDLAAVAPAHARPAPLPRRRDDPRVRRLGRRAATYRRAPTPTSYAARC